jgi:hypothetical protein
MARHPRWKGVGLSTNTTLVVECDGPLASARVDTALDRFLDICPWPAARLDRPWPWGKLGWVAGAREALTRPTVRRASIATRSDLAQQVMAELDDPIDPRREPPVRIALLDGGVDRAGVDGILVLTWFHPLMDARGGENFLAHLNHLDQCESDVPWDGHPPAFVPDPDRRSLIERARIAGRSLAYLRALAPVPPISPATALIPPGRCRFRQESFASAESSRDPRATREFSWRLALVGKAMAELWQRRGLPDVPFLLPVSVDMRPKGERGPTFGSLLAFHFARFRPSDTHDVAELARRLRRQMAEALRDGQIEANAVAMEFLHYRPLSTVLRVMPWTRDGELFSFNCADLSDWPAALARCFGCRVVNAYHVPVVPPRPGIGVFFNRCGDRNNVVVSWIQDTVTDDEVTRIIEAVGNGMGWRTTP